jgi:hypothetical protein
LSNWCFGTTDFARWADLRNHDPEWDKRTQTIAGLVPPGSRLIEFGAGRLQLRKFLDPNCVYFPSDLVSRSSETIVCDLNVRPLPDLSKFNLDVAVLGGVLEYVKNIHSLTRWLSTQVSTCIVSYECAASAPRTLSRIAESLSRARIGWLNTYNEEELKKLFGDFVHTETFGFHDKNGGGRGFIFRKRL